MRRATQNLATNPMFYPRNHRHYKTIRRRIKPSPNLAWLFICVGLCIYQSSYIIEIYLQYDMNVETLYVLTDPFVIPGVTLWITNALRFSCEHSECDQYLNTSVNFYASSYDFMEIVDYLVIQTPDSNVTYLRDDQLRRKKNTFLTRYRKTNSLIYHINQPKIVTAVYFTFFTRHSLEWTTFGSPITKERNSNFFPNRTRRTASIIGQPA